MEDIGLYRKSQQNPLELRLYNSVKEKLTLMVEHSPENCSGWVESGARKDNMQWWQMVRERRAEIYG